jgi:hypothetical protein
VAAIAVAVGAVDILVAGAVAAITKR